MIKIAYQFVKYHSTRWEELVEQGWFTWEVKDGIAKMIYGGK